MLMEKIAFVIGEIGTQMTLGPRINIESHLTLAAARTVLGITVNVVTTTHQRPSLVDGASVVITEKNTFAIEHAQLGVDVILNVRALKLELSPFDLTTAGE
jgi:RNase P/RNase MRP subunit p29